MQETIHKIKWQPTGWQLPKVKGSDYIGGKQDQNQGKKEKKLLK